MGETVPLKGQIQHIIKPHRYRWNLLFRTFVILTNASTISYLTHFVSKKAPDSTGESDLPFYSQSKLHYAEFLKKKKKEIVEDISGLLKFILYN